MQICTPKIGVTFLSVLHIVNVVLGFSPTPAPTARDPLQQPFASWSIWNLPIGTAATLVPANINLSVATTIEADPDVILLNSSEPLTPYKYSPGAWTGKSRCDGSNVLLTAPYPRSFVVPSDGNNYAGAILMTDKRTIKQNQPICHCTPTSDVTTFSVAPDADLYGDGIRGAHGGSGLSSIGGTIRLGEFLPDKNGQVQSVRHALKSNLWAASNYYRQGSDRSSCYRWPAVGCDGYFDDGTPHQYGGHNPALRPGSLLAIDHAMDITKMGLKTTPALNLAWTLQNYGLYLVDDSYWDSVALETEISSTGDYQKEFQNAWGMSFRSNNNDWGRDVQIIFSKLSVVNSWDLNTYNTVRNSNGALGSGGGSPLQPWAPEISPPGEVVQQNK